MVWKTSASLYDAMAAKFDESFAFPGHRRAYDMLAGEYIAALLPPPPAVIVDAGCGTGRWVARWLAQGYRVIGIEQSQGMIEILRRTVSDRNFTLIEASMDDADILPGSADTVVAMGSLQYTSDPAATLGRFAGWVRPGGTVCGHVDSRLGLILDLLRTGRTDEALLRAAHDHGELRYAGTAADLHLYDRETLRRDFSAAGLQDVACRGLLISASVYGREACTEAMTTDADGFLAVERRLSANTALADAGLHLFASGRRPAAAAVMG
jgi:SAM-dependent methyltransferase